MFLAEHSSYAAARVMQIVRQHPRGIGDLKLRQMTRAEGISDREASDAITLLRAAGMLDRTADAFLPGPACDA